MAFQDRPYYRDRSGSTGNPLMWLLTGSVPLFTAFGIHVRAHASLVVTIVLVLLFGFGTPAPLQERLVSATILFLIVLLHEFGHCFAARWVGGEADEILMHPLGGLALTRPPHRPWPMFVTVAGGPLVNVIICVLCGALLWSIAGVLPWNPGKFIPFSAVHKGSFAWFNVALYAWWIYQTSWMLLCFNLLPIFPLDGGQLLQTILWKPLGYYKSMNFACITGMIGAVLFGMWGLAGPNLMLVIIAIFGFNTCMMMRRQLVAAGPYAFEEETTYAAAYEPLTPKRRAPSKWVVRKQAKAAQSERAEQQKIDDILAKVHAHGMNSLNWLERRTLKRATERQRQRDAAHARRTR